MSDRSPSRSYSAHVGEPPVATNLVEMPLRRARQRGIAQIVPKAGWPSFRAVARGACGHAYSRSAEAPSVNIEPDELARHGLGR